MRENENRLRKKKICSTPRRRVHHTSRSRRPRGVRLGSRYNVYTVCTLIKRDREHVPGEQAPKTISKLQYSGETSKATIATNLTLLSPARYSMFTVTGQTRVRRRAPETRRPRSSRAAWLVLGLGLGLGLPRARARARVQLMWAMFGLGLERG